MLNTKGANNVLVICEEKDTLHYPLLCHLFVDTLKKRERYVCVCVCVCVRACACVRACVCVCMCHKQYYLHVHILHTTYIHTHTVCTYVLTYLHTICTHVHTCHSGLIFSGCSSMNRTEKFPFQALSWSVVFIGRISGLRGKRMSACQHAHVG